MTRLLHKYLGSVLLTMLSIAMAGAQENRRPVMTTDDSLRSARIDSLYNSLSDSSAWEKEMEFVRGLNFDDEVKQAQETGLDNENNRHGNRKKRLSWKEQDSLAIARIETEAPEWEPVPRKATLLSLVFPGGGQIYNRKYWKLPVVYGGFMGCVYALTWNQGTYSDYQNAYVDIMDDDPETKSYEDYLPPHYEIDTSMEEWLKDTFKKRKDKYRRYRDLSIFSFAGMYVLSAIDAYVDAELSHFDISPNLSMHLSPDIMIDRYGNPEAAFSLALNF